MRVFWQSIKVTAIVSIIGIGLFIANTPEPSRAAADFTTQLVKMTIPASSLSNTATAPVDFTAVSTTRTIALISGINQHAEGYNTAGSQPPDDISVRIELTDGSTITATRNTAIAQEVHVWVLLIEYTGTPGDVNEFVVRDRRTATLNAVTTASYGPISGVSNTNDVVMFYGGASNNNTGNGDYDRGAVRANMDGTATVNLTRGDGTGIAIASYQAVEFLGSNWTIQTGTSVPANEPASTQTAVTPVLASTTWPYSTWSTNAGNLDELGARVWQSASNTIDVQYHAAAGGTMNVRWYLITNPDMSVQTGAAQDQFQNDFTNTIALTNSVSSLTRSFAWVTGLTNGGGTAHPRTMWQMELLTTSTISLERFYSGQNLDYRYHAIQLPVGSNPVLEQYHYHWRNDDGSETTASSATGGTEDNLISGLPKNTPRRLRIAVSNEGGGSTTTDFRIEYGLYSSSCSAITTWTEVGSGGAVWGMADSTNLTNGNDTTNISVANGGVTDENASFQGTNGGVRDTTSQTGSVTLSATQFTELEFSVEALVGAQDGGTYCFRLADGSGGALDTYHVYPQVMLESFSDFRIQRGTLLMTGTSMTITSSVDYVAPSANNLAFIRITNSHHTGAGQNTGGGTQNIDDVSVHISDQTNITGSVTFARQATAASDSHVDWEIIEYTGATSGGNEMFVRNTSVQTFGTAATTLSTAAIGGITDANDVMVFITGVSNPDTGTADYNTTQAVASFNTSTNVVTLDRGEAGGDATSVSIAVVEFAGPNWTVQRSSHTYAAAGATETETITSVNDISRAFIHTQKSVGTGLQGIDEMGHTVWLSDSSTISYEIQGGAGTPASHISAAWVLENTQTRGNVMVVTRSNGSSAGGAEPFSTNINIGTTLADTSIASIFANTRSTGTGTAHPRAIAGFLIASASQYQLWRSDTGQTLTYRTEVVEWPTAAPYVNQGAYRWFTNSDSLTPSSTLAAQDTSSTLSVPAEQFRLRLLADLFRAEMRTSTESFRLEFAVRSSTCDTGFVGESYSVVSSTSAISFYNNASINTGDALVTGGNDPTLAGTTTVAQTYIESNTFANTNTLAIDEAALWDISLYDNGAPTNTPYCFRVTYGDGTLLDTYSVIPEIQTSDGGTISVDIVDAGGTSVATPTVQFPTTTASLSCQSVTSTLGSSNERIRIDNQTLNPSWTLSMAALTSNTSTWISTGTPQYDYNDSSGCTDGGDTDTLAGQLTVDPSVATISPQGTCGTTGLTLGSSAGFDEGTTDAITLISAGSSASTTCYWDLTGVSLDQSIPELQEAASYNIDIVLTVVAS